MAERFEISESELDEANKKNEDEITSIPVLQRFLHAKSQGQKLQCPTCVIVVGMAGTGKTTLMSQLQQSISMPPESKNTDSSVDEPEPQVTKNNEAEAKMENDSGIAQSVETEEESSDKVGYCLNLDPATKLVPFGASIDIRDTVDYKEVMKQHSLGPNGAIMTSLNLFATKFDQVMSILERRSFGDEGNNTIDSVQESMLDYILVDTPGQIEAFTWSASGSIMCEGLASSFPTVLAFVVDTPRCASSPHTFMSNMLYACSMLYRTRLPLVIVFNKIDVVPHEFAMEWMDEFDSFQDSLDEASSSSDGGISSGYYTSLTRSLGLVLDEFYRGLHRCGVSAATGQGIDEFWATVDRAAADFETEYLSDLQNRIEEQKAKARAKARASVRRLGRDVAASQGHKR